MAVKRQGLLFFFKSSSCHGIRLWNGAYLASATCHGRSFLNKFVCGHVLHFIPCIYTHLCLLCLQFPLLALQTQLTNSQLFQKSTLFYLKQNSSVSSLRSVTKVLGIFSSECWRVEKLRISWIATQIWLPGLFHMVVSWSLLSSFLNWYNIYYFILRGGVTIVFKSHTID